MKEKYTEEQLFKLLSALADQVAEMDDAEFLAEVKAAGNDPKKDAAVVRNIISRVQKGLDSAKLRQARVDYEQELRKLKGFVPTFLPAVAAERRSFLVDLSNTRPGFGRGATTAQFRNVDTLSDIDVSSLLHKLQYLLKGANPSDSSGEAESTANLEPTIYETARGDENSEVGGSTSPFYKSPSEFLKELKITEPDEIDVEALAYLCGAIVVYEPLKGCEAYLIATGTDKAVITVNSPSLRARQRFSVAHELGHWMRDRNSSAFCEKKSYNESWYGQGSEVLANKYAKELLLPEFLFAPLAKNLPVTFESVRKLAELFGTSLTATALRLAELGSYPAVIVFSRFSRTANTEPAKKTWYFKGADVAADLNLHWKMNNKALAYEICIDDEKHEVSGDIDAGAWFIVSEDQSVVIHEESIRINCNFILTMLSWEQDVESI